MFRKAFSFGGLLLLAGATVLVTPGFGQAQHHGGGHGGGFHGGGFHGGGFHGGGFNHGSFHHGGFNHGGFHDGGFHHGSFHNGGFHHGDFHHGDFHHGGFHHGGFVDGGFHHDGFHHGGRWWYPGFYGLYGAWPYNYGGYSDYYPYSYDAPSYDWSGPAYDSTYYGLYVQEAPSYPDSYTSVAPPTASGQVYYPPAAVASDTALAQPNNTAHVTVTVPADAEIWFQGAKMTSTGSVRQYQSPPLTPGIRYAYEVRARWNENRREVTQTQRIEVTAGTRVNVQFPVQPTKAPTAPSL
jgi:uncharacterized protein (TIGR03000 family)